MTTASSARARRGRSARATAPTQKRAIVYARISLDRSGEGAGVERQRQACEALAVARDWRVIETVEDTISATKVKAEDRPGWSRVLGMIERDEIDVIIAWHMDRIVRSMVDLEQLITLCVDHDVAIATATGDMDLSTDSGRLVARILAAVARGEGERKAARMVLAHEQRATTGRPNWVRRPFGYEMDGSLREPEAALIRQAYADVLNGRSLSQVARDWTDAGFEAHGGGPWQQQSARHVLRSARNAGLSTYYGDVVGQATWQAIVDESTWRALDRLLADPARYTGGGPRAYLLTLTGITSCDVCGSHVRVQWRGGKGTEKGYPVYQCMKGCVSIPMDYLDGVALRELTKRASELDITDLTAIDTPDLAPLRAKAADLAEQMALLGEDFADGHIDRRTMLAGTARLREHLDAAEAEIASAGRTGVWQYVDVQHLYQEFDGASIEVQRAIISSVFASIKIKARGRGRALPKREHIELEFTKEWQIDGS